MQTKEHLLTQLDYLKILIEEDRFGESHDRLHEFKENLISTCKTALDKFKDVELELPKTLIKTKPNQWVYLNRTWIKVISITKSEICFEINKGNILKKLYRVKKDIALAIK